MKTKKVKREPGLGWVLGNALERSRSLTFLFLFLFIIALPIALLIIGRENYSFLTSRPSYLITDYLAGHLNSILLPLHVVLGFLSLAALVVLASVQFRTLYIKNAVDKEASMPLDRNQQFFGRVLALLIDLTLIFAVTGNITWFILSGWGFGDHFMAYLPLFIRLFVTLLELTAFSLVFLVLSGTLFDVFLTAIGIQLAWVTSIFHILDMTGRLHDPPSFLLWFLTPAAGPFTSMIWPLSLLRAALMIVLWTLLAWYLYRRRPSENAGVRSGRLAWHAYLQPLYVLFGGINLGRFVHALFAWNRQESIFQSPVFYIGLAAGAILGQLTSTAISGGLIRKQPPMRQILPIISGLLLFGLLTALIQLGIAPAVSPW